MKLLLLLSLTTTSAKDGINPLSEHLGCPENSICSKEQGAKYLEFNKLLSDAAQRKSTSKINQFLKLNGPLISGWIKATPAELEQNSKRDDFLMAVFDSPCQAHRPKVKDGEEARVNTFKSEVFFNKVIVKNFIPHYAYLQSGENIQKFLIPLRNIPFLIKDQKLVFLMETNGVYYNFAINKNNEASIDFDKYPSHEIQSTACPNSLIQEYKKDQNSLIYEYYDCKSIWNENTKSYLDILYGQSC